MSVLSISLWIASGLLAAMYLMAGLMKVKDPVKAQEMNATMAAQSAEKIRFIGVAELLGAIGIILPFALGILPWLSGVAAAALVLVQVLAISEHIKHKDTKQLPMNVLLLLLAAFVALGRFNVF